MYRLIFLLYLHRALFLLKVFILQIIEVFRLFIILLADCKIIFCWLIYGVDSSFQWILFIMLTFG